MKLLLENWRKFLNEKKWEDFEYPKGQWADVSVDDIKSSGDPINVDLADELFDLIDNAYKGIGGHFDFNNSGDLPADHDDWLAMDWDEDPEPDVLRVGRHQPAGIKMTVAGHDGQSQSKRAYIQKTLELLGKPGYYAEMSKRIADIMINAGVPYVNDPELVQKTLGPSKEIQWIGAHPEGKHPDYNGWYTRTVGGHPGELKIMFGTPQ
jgi:hypothetical protein